MNLTPDEIQLLIQTVEQTQYAGKLSELVSSVLGKLRNAQNIPHSDTTSDISPETNGSG